MAVPARNGYPQSNSNGPHTPTEIQHAAARLYARGMSRKEISHLLWQYMPLQTPKRGQTKQIQARIMLRRWEETGWFRDMVWEYSVAKMDMTMPAILDAVANKAKRGRVDAARFIGEVTGRHNPRTDGQTPAVVNISFGSALPRPQLEESVDGEVESEDDG